MPRVFQQIGWGLVTGIWALWALAGPTFSAPDPSPPPAAESAPLTLSLPEAIHLALRNNRSVKSAYLDRVVQKFNLEVARDKFVPNVNLNAAPAYSGGTTDTQGQETSSDTSSWGHSSSIAADKLFETGGKFTFTWGRSDSYPDTNTSSWDWTGVNTWKVNFTHPLLKGFGRDVNTASVILAEIAEQSNLLALRDTLISTVDQTISAFRAYAKAVRQVEISRASVERSKALLETNRLLISMGRMPANEIIQTESDVANQELSHETALNSMDNARLSLLQVLDLDKNIQITPVEETDLTPVHPDMETCLVIAFKNRADFLNAQFGLEQANIAVNLAQDNMKWSLDAAGAYTVTDTTSRRAANANAKNWELGLNLLIPIYGDLTREQGLISAQTGLEKSKLNLAEVKQTITLGVKNAIREVETSLKQVGMAVRARELSEKKLAVEKEKLAVGRSTNFQLVTYQNDLVQSLQNELDAKVAYLNALKALDTFLATTLSTWKIDYNKENDRWPGQ